MRKRTYVKTRDVTSIAGKGKAAQSDFPPQQSLRVPVAFFLQNAATVWK